jgi:quinohemoprotein ethanol dehydrogenase
MSLNTHEQFNLIVLKGALSSYGMANFSDVLDEAKAEALHQYLIDQQKKLFVDSLNIVVK